MKINDGARAPFGYGVAWRNYESMTWEVYFVPFNIAFRWVREFYRFLAKPRRNYEETAWRAGRDEGMRIGELRGIIRGKQEKETEIMQNIQDVVRSATR